MKYISVEEAGKKFNLSARSVRNYCSQGRIAGAVLKGKTWLIPIDASKPDRSLSIDNEAIKDSECLIKFINESPTSFVAIKNVSNILLKNEFIELFENKKSSIEKGKKYFFIRNDSSLIAINVGKNVSGESGFNIVTSHADSPCLKIKPECDGKTDIYNKINVSVYGGLILPSYIDRPLAVSGRIITKENDKLVSHIVNYPDLVSVVPNVCIHFNTSINKGYEYNPQVDMQVLYSQERDESPLLKELAKRLKVKNEDISNFDLYLYNKESGIIWGDNKEYISSPRLDDLECVYTSLRGFIEGNNDNNINVLYICDNEEVGSSSIVGADSDFLFRTLKRISKDLKLDFDLLIANSFLVSADNAHAVHPNKGELSDKDNRLYMNKGIAIKYSSSLSYTTDAVSSAIFQKICDNASIPYQFFTNRSDIRGGGTLGKYLLTQVSMLSVDVGLSQLAMHSSYETAGSTDVKYAIKVFKEFYSSNIKIDKDNYEIRK